MNWGSTWEVADYAEVNWWNLYLAEGNDGGTAFGASQPMERRREPNPLLRVRPAASAAPAVSDPSIASTNSTSTESESLHVRAERELIYATEQFDRQQPVTGKSANTRWRAGGKGLQVPVLDSRLVVAFQKVLRDEEIEFFLLVTAMDEGDYREH